MKSDLRKKTALTGFLILIIGLASPLASNLYLPSMPALSGYFHTNDDVIQLTITSFLLSFGVFQLIYGPLSDRFGRRKILFIGFLIAMIGSIACAASKTAWQLIAARFILGAGVAVSSALSRSILRDAFSGQTLMIIATRIFTILSLTPMVATLIGSYLDAWFGWQFNFIILVIFIVFDCAVVWFYFSETNQHLHLSALKPKQLFKDYWHVLSNPIFLGNTLCAGFASAAVTVYNALSPFLFQDNLGLTVIQYGWISAVIASGMVIGRFITSLLMRKFSSYQVMLLGQLLMLFSGFFLLILEPLHWRTLTIISLTLAAFLTGTAIMMPFASLQALEPFAKHAGLAGGLYGAVTLLIASVVSLVVAVMRDNFLSLLAVVYILLSLATLLVLAGIKIYGKTHQSDTSGAASR